MNRTNLAVTEQSIVSITTATDEVECVDKVIRNTTNLNAPPYLDVALDLADLD